MSQDSTNHDRLTFDQLDDWVKPSIAWRYLGVSRSNLYEMIRSHALPAKRWGKRSVRIPNDALTPRINEYVGV